MWNWFSEKEPKIGREITLIWNDGSEGDFIWCGKESIDWTRKIVPILWKYRQNNS